ncbi:MAG: BamA/TamA family outer membrane protein [Chitinophagales bacterium]|nr:BamA/TamA family outer membrane protein [Chitinophagales bacterium]
MRSPIFLLMLYVALIAGGCSGTKHLPEGEKLYTGAEVKFTKEGDVPKTKALQGEVENVIVPKPNSTIFGIFRPKLWFYMVTDTPKGKGLRYFVKNKLGEPPVLIRKVDPVTTSSLIQNRLENNGYFRTDVSYEKEEKPKTAKIIYTAALHAPYRIDSISFPPNVTALTSKISEVSFKTLVKRGEIYNLNVLKAERERIDIYLKDEGFFYFNPDYLEFYADTFSGNRKVNLSLVLKEDVPPKAVLRYHMGDIFIDPKFTLDKDTTHVVVDTLNIEGKYYLNTDNTFNPKTITQSVFFDRNDYYTRRNHDITLRRLMGLGIFKFVNIEFEDEITLDSALLHASVYLTPLRKKSLRAELLGISKSTNYAGPGLDMSYRNRNFLRGSELFILSGEVGLESQVSGHIAGQPSLGSFAVSGKAQLFVPKFIVPFYRINNVSSYYVPKTKFELNAEKIIHPQYFTLNSLEFTYGYNWKEGDTKEHELDPVAINYVNVTNTQLAFDTLLLLNPFLRKNFEKQFILGLQYSYTFNNQVVKRLGHQYYFRGTTDFSGNLFSLINNTFNQQKTDPENPVKLFNLPYSQYSRFDVDGRYYYVFDKNNKIATRLKAGIGIPYGNSDALPYIKQFFIGGSNSIRAFRSRTIGPGTYPPPPDSTITFFEQAGDMRLEGSAEYRFNIISILKGALFVDAGNIWLLHEDTLRPGGVFQKDFLSEVAVGTGFGIRADANFFVLRLDLAMPIRKPWLQPGDRWVFDQISFGNSDWRKENLVLNIAIGYPF